MHSLQCSLRMQVPPTSATGAPQDEGKKVGRERAIIAQSLLSLAGPHLEQLPSEPGGHLAALQEARIQIGLPSSKRQLGPEVARNGNQLHLETTVYSLQSTVYSLQLAVCSLPPGPRPLACLFCWFRRSGGFALCARFVVLILGKRLVCGELVCRERESAVGDPFGGRKSQKCCRLPAWRRPSSSAGRPLGPQTFRVASQPASQREAQIDSARRYQNNLIGPSRNLETQEQTRAEHQTNWGPPKH